MWVVYRSSRQVLNWVKNMRKNQLSFTAARCSASFKPGIFAASSSVLNLVNVSRSISAWSKASFGNFKISYQPTAAASSAASIFKALLESTNVANATPTVHPLGSLPGFPYAPIWINLLISEGSIEVSSFSSRAAAWWSGSNSSTKPPL